MAIDFVKLSEAEVKLGRVSARGTLRKRAQRGTIPAKKVGGRWVVDREWLEQEMKNPIPVLWPKKSKSNTKKKRSIIARELARARHDQDIGDDAGRVLALRKEWETKTPAGEYLVPEEEWEKIDSLNLTCLCLHLEAEWPKDFEKIKGGGWIEFFKKSVPQEILGVLHMISKKRMFEEECPLCRGWYC